jgi:hypothetical protein
MLVFFAHFIFFAFFFSRRNHRRFTIFVRKNGITRICRRDRMGGEPKEETISITTTWDGMI